MRYSLGTPFGRNPFDSDEIGDLVGLLLADYFGEFVERHVAVVVRVKDGVTFEFPIRLKAAVLCRSQRVVTLKIRVVL